MKKNINITSGEILLLTGLVLAASSTLLVAQTTNSNPVAGTNSVLISTNDAVAPTNGVGQIVTNFLARRGDDAPVAAATNLVSPSNTNIMPRLAGNGLALTRAAGATNAAPVIPANIPGRPLYSAFKIINDRNIFDPNRRPGMTNVNPDRPRPVEVESFSLTAIISSEKGTYAFFNSSSYAYKKALKESGAIAGYTVAYIEPPDLVELESGGKTVELTVGTGLRRRDGGPWEKVDSTPSFSSPDSGSRSGGDMMGSQRGNFNSEAPTNVEAGGNTSSGGGASDALRRLMLKREQELKNEKP